MKLLPIIHSLLGLRKTATANQNTRAGDKLLVETARLVNYVNIMEHEMINGPFKMAYHSKRIANFLFFFK